jgi:hypothetical protein
MFVFQRTRYGNTYPVPVFFINKTQEEQTFENVTISASTDAETLELVMTGTMRFVSETVEYVAPFDGSDFVTAREGTLYITITESLSAGLYQTFFVNSILIPGVCGYGLFGSIQGGQVSRFQHNTPIVLQVQALPEDWVSGVLATVQPYSVPTVIRP